MNALGLLLPVLVILAFGAWLRRRQGPSYVLVLGVLIAILVIGGAAFVLWGGGAADRLERIGASAVATVPVLAAKRCGLAPWNSDLGHSLRPCRGVTGLEAVGENR